MRVLAVTQGEWGERIVRHLEATQPDGWTLVEWRAPSVLPIVIDEPDELLPEVLPQADLLLLLTESAGLTDLGPDIAALCGAQAAIVPVDRRSWAPPGLRRQVRQRLQTMGVPSVFPTPFCSLTPSAGQHTLIAAFARRYGRPELDCAAENGQVIGCEVWRETPCGNTRYIAERLVGVAVEKAAEQAGLLHHYYPCWGGMDTDPVLDEHTLLHIAATLAQKAVTRTLRTVV